MLWILLKILNHSFKSKQTSPTLPQFSAHVQQYSRKRKPRYRGKECVWHPSPYFLLPSQHFPACADSCCGFSVPPENLGLTHSGRHCTTELQSQPLHWVLMHAKLSMFTDSAVFACIFRTADHHLIISSKHAVQQLCALHDPFKVLGWQGSASKVECCLCQDQQK